MRYFHTLLALLFAVSTAIAQTTIWTGATDLNWSNAANWSNGLPTTGGIAVLPAGAPAPVLVSNLSIDFEVQNFVTIQLSGTVTNGGHFINFGGGVVENRANLTNNGSIQFDNGGRFDNFEQFTNNGNILQTGSGTWYNHPAATMTIGASGSFSDFGYFENRGTLNNLGIFTLGAEFQNFGTLNNQNIFLIGSGNGKIVNQSSGNIEVGTNGVLDVQGTLDNLGAVTSRGAFKTTAGGQFFNKNVFTNFSVARNFGTTINTGTYNIGINGQDTTGIFQYVDYGSVFRNKKDLYNFGTLELMPCSEFYQESVTGTPVTGRVWLMGIVYEIQGLVEKKDIMGGVVLHGSEQPAPTARCKNAVVDINTSTGIATVTPALIDNGSTADYCEIANLSVSPANFNCSQIGNRQVTLTVTDAKGNTQSCNATVNVRPSTACQGCFNVTHPGSISGDQTICAGEIPVRIESVQPASGGVGTPEYLWLRWTVDPLANPNAYTAILNSNTATFQPGALSVTTWFRRCARTSSCTDFIAETGWVKITVNERPNASPQVTPPTCENPTGTVTLQNLTPGTSVSLNGQPAVLDQSVFSNLPSGTHTVLLSKANCTRTLTFEVPSAPIDVPTPQLAITQPSCDFPMGSVTVTNVPVGYQVRLDNGIFSNQFSFNGLAVGPHTITINNGVCQATANFNINPVIATQPNVICREMTIELVNGVATITALQIDAGSTAGCGSIANLTLNQTTFSQAGNYTVTLTVTNSFGQSSTCTANVRVTNPPAPCPNNLLTSGNFEGDLPGWWRSGAGDVVSTGAYSGQKAYEICGAEGGTGVGLPVVPGEVVSVSAFAKISGSPSCAGLKLEFFNRNFQKIEGNEQWVNITSTNWQQYTATLTAPADAFYVQPLVWKCANGCLTVDDICVVKTGRQPFVCQSTVLPQGNFEGNLDNWWQSGSGAPTTTSPYSGTKSYEICNGEGGAGVTLPTVPGETFTYNAFAKVAGMPNCAGLEIIFFNSNWQKISGAGQWMAVNTTSYELYSFSATAPAGAAHVQFSLWKCAGGCFYVDEICVVRAAPVCPTPQFNVTQPAFCQGTGSITITNLPTDFCTRIDNGTWTPNRTSYTGIAPGVHTISFSGPFCETTVSFTINPGQNTPIPQFSIEQPSSCSANTGSITITNLPQGYSSQLDNGTWTLGKTNYTGISAGQHTITIGKDGCNASATFNIVAVTNNTPTPIISITQPACGSTTGSITITNLPQGFFSSLDGGAWTQGKTSYTGITVGQHTISIGANNCNASTTFAINATGGMTMDVTKCFRIINKVSGKALTVLNNSTANGAQIVQWDYSGTANQVWQFEDAGNGFYFLKARHSGKVIDIEGGSQEQHAYAIQWGKHGGANQQFFIESIGSGFVKISARHSCQAIKLAASPGSNGTRVFQAVYSNSYEHAKWKIEEIPCTSNTPPPSVCNKNVLFVVGCPNPLNNGDTWVLNRLQQMGLTVQLISDTQVQASHTSDKGLVIISSTVNSNNIGTRLTNIAVPLITWEPALLDDLKMTGTSTSQYGATSGTWMYINYNHPITAGVSTGWVQAFGNCSPTMNWGIPSNNAHMLADISNGCTIFAYDAGKGMVGLNAPARRAFLFLNDWSATCLNWNGRQIFDNTIEWAIGCVMPNLGAVVQTSSLTFDAHKKDYSTAISWISSTGDRNNYFVIERSANGMDFQPLQKIDGKGTAGEMLYFNEIDEKPLPGDNFYRLRLVYLDGREIFSEVKVVNFADAQHLEIFPNPANEAAYLSLSDFEGKKVEVWMVNSVGVPVQNLTVEAATREPIFLDLKPLTEGYYAVVVQCEGIRKTQRLIVSKL